MHIVNIAPKKSLGVESVELTFMGGWWVRFCLTRIILEDSKSHGDKVVY